MSYFEHKVGDKIITTTASGALSMYATPFGRLKTAQATTLMNEMFTNTRRLESWEEKKTAGGNITGPVSSMVTLTCNGAGTAIRQTHQYFTYMPGKTQVIMVTGVLHVSGAPTGAIFRMGSYDNAGDKSGSAPDVNEGNGHFFEANNTSGTMTYHVVQRSSTSGSVVDTKVARSAWNVDKLDGTGQSKISIDFTKSNVFVIERAWLGVGSAKMSVLYGGMPIPCHVFLNESTVATPYMARATLPIRYEIDASAVTSGTSTMIQICSTVQVEGSFDPVGLAYSYTDTQTLTTNQTFNVMALRLNPSYPRVLIQPLKLGFAIYNTNAAMIFCDLLYNPVITGGSWTLPPNATNSFAQVNSNFTNLTGGRLVSSMPVGQSNVVTDFNTFGIGAITYDMTGTSSDIIAIRIRVIGSVNNGATFGMSLTWQEFV